METCGETPAKGVEKVEGALKSDRCKDGVGLDSAV